MFREDLHGDVKVRMNGVAPTPTIRRCVESDIAWLMELAKVRYAENEYEPAAVAAWLKERMNDPHVCMVRGRNTVGICHVTRRFLAPSRWQAYLILLVSFPQKSLSMEPYRVSEALVDWAKAKGATKFWLSDISGYDLGVFATRMGGRTAGHTYVIDLDDKGGRYG